MNQNNPDIPEDFSRRIHEALRAWHSQNTSNTLDDLILAHQAQAEQPGASPRLITNQILLSGIDCLKQSDSEAADLLQRRFLNQETAQEVAYRRNLSEDIVFQRQRNAIAQLAEWVWRQERELRQQRLRQIEMRLETPSYTRLFGVADQLAELRLRVENACEPWLIALEGLGGLGKTSLADALARQLANSGHFHEIGWVSARRRLFHLAGDVETLEDAPDLTLAELVDRLAEQFGLFSLRHLSDTEKLAGVREHLRTHPSLVIVDNLETVGNVGAFAVQLAGLANPSKFLLTTRYSLHNVSGVYVLTLRQLSQPDTLALIRHEAELRGLPELAQAPAATLDAVYTVTGGNPLATKLLVGQVHTLSLPVVLKRFRTASGKPVEELLSFLYEAAWQSLDTDCRRVLQAMTLVAEDGGKLEQVAAAAELDEDRAADCLQSLARRSLVNVGGNLHERRYSLHPLTQTFVLRQTG
jgi:hypothetical protein